MIPSSAADWVASRNPLWWCGGPPIGSCPPPMPGPTPPSCPGLGCTSRPQPAPGLSTAPYAVHDRRTPPGVADHHRPGSGGSGRRLDVPVGQRPHLDALAHPGLARLTRQAGQPAELVGEVVVERRPLVEN